MVLLKEETSKEKIIKMNAKGQIQNRSLEDIGKELGISRQRVSKLLQELEIKKTRFDDVEKRKMKSAEKRWQMWDDLARCIGFGDFQDLTNELGIRRQWQVKRIAQVLGRNQSDVGKMLKKHGYAPPKPVNFRLGFWRGMRQSEEHKAKRVAAFNRTKELKKRLGIPFHCPKEEWQHLIEEE